MLLFTFSSISVVTEGFSPCFVRSVNEYWAVSLCFVLWSVFCTLVRGFMVVRNQSMFCQPHHNKVTLSKLLSHGQ